MRIDDQCEFELEERVRVLDLDLKEIGYGYYLGGVAYSSIERTLPELPKTDDGSPEYRRIRSMHARHEQMLREDPRVDMVRMDDEMVVYGLDVWIGRVTSTAPND